MVHIISESIGQESASRGGRGGGAYAYCKLFPIEDALDRSKLSQGLAGMQITGLQTSLRSGSSRHADLFQGIARA